MTPRALSILKTAIRNRGQRCILTAKDNKTNTALRYLYRMDLIDYSKPYGKPGWFILKEFAEAKEDSDDAEGDAHAYA